MAGLLAERTPSTDVIIQLKGLPEEVLVYILLFLTKEPNFRQAEMLGPAHVCRHCYNIILSAQSLWRQIDVTAVKMVKAVLAVNTSGPLDVRCIVNEIGAGVIHPAGDRLYSQEIWRAGVYNRIESVIWDRPFAPLSKWKLPPFQIPNVRSLTLIIRPSRTWVGPASLVYELGEGVNLDELNIENVRLQPWNSPRLTALRILSIYEVKMLDISVETLRTILSSSNNLVSLRLGYLKIQEVQGEAVETPNMIDMPQLKDLVLVSVPNQYAEVLVHYCSFSAALVTAMFDQTVGNMIRSAGAHGYGVPSSPFQERPWSLFPYGARWKFVE